MKVLANIFIVLILNECASKGHDDRSRVDNVVAECLVDFAIAPSYDIKQMDLM